MGRMRVTATITMAGLIFAALGVSARAEMLVLDSNIDKFKAGDRLPDNTVIGPLPPGMHVQVLLGNNTTKLFQGPVKAELPIGGTRGLKPKPKSQ